MEKKNNQHKGGMSGKVMVGAGLAAAAAAAAGAYFLYGTEAGKQKRQDIKGWSLKMRGEILEKMEHMKEWSEKSYEEIVESVARNYRTLQSIDHAELEGMIQDMKKHWHSIQRHLEEGKNHMSSSANTTSKKPAKKSTKKSS